MLNEVESELVSKTCRPLPEGTPALPNGEVERLATAVPAWSVVDNRIEREYVLPSYMAGVRWFALLASIAEQEDHHPDAVVTWCRVKLTLWTHTVRGLSENDFILAAKLERAWREFK